MPGVTSWSSQIAINFTGDGDPISCRGATRGAGASCKATYPVVSCRWCPVGKAGRLYRFNVSQSVLQDEPNDARFQRLPAAELQSIVMAQVRAMLCRPEVMVGTLCRCRGERAE